MALNTPSNLYSGYAQVFNEAPHIAFRARLMAQHQAKQEALDNYYKRLPLMINEKGVRDQERPAIAKSMLGIKDYYIKNKEGIRKGDDAAAFNYEKMIRDHQDLVSSSQNAGLTDLQLGKLKFNPSVQYMFQGKDTIDQIAAHHLPITDPNHVDFDLETFTAPPKPLVKDTYMRRYDKLKFDDSKVVTNNPDGTQTITNTPKPSKEALDSIMAGAAFDYIHEPSVAIAIDQLGEADNTNPYNSVFKENFGRDIQTPIDVNAAFILANKTPQPKTEKVQTNQLGMLVRRQNFSQAQQQRQFRHAELMQQHAEGYRETFKKFSTSLNAGEQDNILNKFIDISATTGTNRWNGKKVEKVTIDGQDYKGKFIDVPKSMTSEDAINTGTSDKPVWEVPNRYYLSDDKKTVIPIFFGVETSTGGNYIKQGLSKPIPIHIWKERLAKDFIGKRQQGAEIVDDDLTDTVEDNIPIKTTTKETHTIQTTSSKPVLEHSREDYKSAGWTDEQINKALKAGKIKVK